LNSHNALAQSTSDSNEIINQRQYLTFILATEEYAVDILRVQEIRGWTPVTLIPNAPDYLKGVLNLRGEIIPVIELRKRFGLPSIDYGPTTVVVVLKVLSGHAERVMGVVVDAVAETYNIDLDSIAAAPAVGGNIEAEFIDGLVTIDEKMLVLLDIDELMNSGELSMDSATERADA